MDQETKSMFELVLKELGDFKHDVTEQFHVVDQRLGTMDRRFDRLEAMGKSNGDHTIQLLKMVGSVNTSLHEVKESVKMLEANQSLVDKRLNVHRDDIADVRERVAILEQENL